MNFGSESLLVTLLVGGVVGWLAGLVMRGSGYGIIGDVIVGLVGAYVGSWLFQWMRLTVNLGNPILNKAVVALVGAVILLLWDCSALDHCGNEFRHGSSANDRGAAGRVR